MKLEKNIKAIKAQGARVVAVSVDTDDIPATRKKSRLSFEVMADPDLDLIKAWGVPVRGGISSWASFVVDGTGRVRHAKHGYSEDLSSDVLRALKTSREP